MGWGTGNIGDGSGGGLNFKVVGNPQPETPKENTIWVDTDVDITSWIFSATEPAAAEEGMVWISTGTSSTVAFSATKKNPVMVYPLSAKQYISGALVDKTTKSYQGGKWVDWIPYLYNAGDECTGITGGWGAYCPNDGYSIGTLTKNASSIKISASGYRNLIRCETKNVVDLSKYKAVYVNVTAISGLYEAHVAIADSHTDVEFNASTLITSKGLKKVSVAGINRGIVVIQAYTEDGGSGSLTFNEVYAE